MSKNTIKPWRLTSFWQHVAGVSASFLLWSECGGWLDLGGQDLPEPPLQLLHVGGFRSGQVEASPPLLSIPSSQRPDDLADKEIRTWWLLKQSMHQYLPFYTDMHLHHFKMVAVPWLQYQKYRLQKKKQDKTGSLTVIRDTFRTFSVERHGNGPGKSKHSQVLWRASWEVLLFQQKSNFKSVSYTLVYYFLTKKTSMWYFCVD